MSTLTKPGAKAAEYAVLAAALFFVLPLYIDSQVEQRVNELDNNAPDPLPLSEAAPIVELSTKVDSLTAQADRIERKVDDFAGAFRRYLERQAQ